MSENSKHFVVKLLIIIPAIYILLFFILMDFKHPAYSEIGEKKYECSFRFGPGIAFKEEGGMTSLVAKESLFNIIYYPIDVILKTFRRS